ncbi:uncharacterized protein V1510DRAFT_375739 [Dipodascopsis tothii]|uniref:uncharacterized protein n=1 Tax=Dipodascopsis tothii TaxID=44089 RepID=UPI0034CDAE34
MKRPALIEDDDDLDSRRAYSAFLTLLKPAEPEKPARRSKAKPAAAAGAPAADAAGEPATQADPAAVDDSPARHTRSHGAADQPAAGEPADDADADNNDDLAETEDVAGSDDEDDRADPFQTHFAAPDAGVLDTLADAVGKGAKWTPRPLKSALPGHKAVLTAPGDADVPALHTALPSRGVADMKIKHRLLEPFAELNRKAVKRQPGGAAGLTPLQTFLAPAVLSNQDVLFTSRNVRNADELQNLYCLHMLNHVYKTRDLVIKNNTHMARAADKGATEDVEYRDQGFTRPKVLVLLPTRDACYRLVEKLIKLSGNPQNENHKRFEGEYFADAQVPKSKPEDFRELFSGNNDDNFRLGLKFTRKSVKLFTAFYNSDVIVASPLGLRLIVGDETDVKRDFDFLSSIELLVIDQADALLMQNWQHVAHVLKHVNLIPRDSHDCDFSRLRSWYLDERAPLVRQTIVLADYIAPEINALFSHHMRNVAGRLKVKPVYGGVLDDVGAPIPQKFTRLYSPTPQDDADRRFKFFVVKALPALIREAGVSSAGTLLFIPSYVDFVRVRNYMDSEFRIHRKTGAKDVTFSAASEYTSVPDLTRARSYFVNGTSKFLLYTERLHHFRRYDVRGADTVFMYALPENPRFYVEICRFLLRTVADGTDVKNVAVKALFSRWDAMKLERIVGAERVASMSNGVNEIFEFS